MSEQASQEQPAGAEAPTSEPTQKTAPPSPGRTALQALIERDSASQKKAKELSSRQEEADLGKLLKENPTEALRGLFAPPPEPQEPDPNERISQLEARLQEFQQQAEQRTKQQQAIEAWKTIEVEVAQYLGDSEDYPLTVGTDQANVVVDLIRRHLQDTGQLLSYEDAASHVESYLAGLAEKVRNLGNGPMESDEPLIGGSPSTLTRDDTSQVGVRSAPSQMPSRDEELKHMLSLLRYTDE